jgi:hypothetical protein
MPWNIIADPKDENTSHNCKLCKRPLVAPPLHELQIDGTKDIKIEGKLSKGRCGDVFHEKCILNSVGSGCISCPTCNVPWQQAKILRSSIVTGNIENLTIKKKTSSA